MTSFGFGGIVLSRIVVLLFTKILCLRLLNFSLAVFMNRVRDAANLSIPLPIAAFQITLPGKSARTAAAVWPCASSATSQSRECLCGVQGVGTGATWNTHFSGLED